MTTPFGDSTELLPGDGSARLVPRMFGHDDAELLFEALKRAVPWETTQIPMFGREVTEPRLSAWIADEGVVYRYSGRDRARHPWSEALTEIRRLAEHMSSASFNGVLANLYRTGNDHMGWHADDERSLGANPIIASVSLGAERRFDFRHRESGELISTVLPHGSLLVMSGATQRCWKHRIPRAAKVTEPRINLTFRRLV